MRSGRALALLAILGSALLGAVLAAAPPAGAAEPAQVRFAESSLQVVEGSAVRVLVERVDLPVSRLIVHYRTADVPGSAAAGPDYVQASGSLVFDVGVRSSSFTVLVRGDEVAEETEHLLLHLETSSGSGASTRLTILDDDADASATGVETMGSGGGPAAPSGAPASGSFSAPPASAPPVVVVTPARSSRTVTVAAPRRVRATAKPAPRRIILQQTPTTPFELRPVQGAGGAGGTMTRVDPLLALGAGLLLARVAAEVWFRLRLAAA